MRREVLSRDAHQATGNDVIYCPAAGLKPQKLQTAEQTEAKAAATAKLVNKVQNNAGTKRMRGGGCARLPTAFWFATLTPWSPEREMLAPRM